MREVLDYDIVWAFVPNAGRSSNGRTAAFEAVNLGSIPSLPAVRRKKLCQSK